MRQADDKVMGRIDARNMASDKQGALIYTGSMVSKKGNRESPLVHMQVHTVYK